MKNIYKLLLIICLFNVYSVFSQSTKVGGTNEIKDKEIDWEEFDETSTKSKSEIKFDDLQGLWSAYEGIYRFGEHINGMKLTQPIIIEVINDSYRRNLKSEHKKFTISENVITLKDKNEVEVGIINKITENELVISWKDKSNYTRYYYKK